MIRPLLSFALLAAVCFAVGIAAPAQAEDPQLAHMVFFKLAESNAANQEKLVAACDKYLSGHEGTVYYSAGVIAKELDRDVNDREFDVALHVVFKDKAAHDVYQTHPRHLKFIAENKELWSGVRVFDSYVKPVAAKAQEGVCTGFQYDGSPKPSA